MEQNNSTWYVYRIGKKIIKTQKKPTIETSNIAIFPTEKAADSYVEWRENLHKWSEE